MTTTKTFNLSATFTEQEVLEFAKYKGWSETVMSSDGTVIDNQLTAEQYISDYFMRVLTSEISTMVKNKELAKLDQQRQLIEQTIESKVKDNLSITIE